MELVSRTTQDVDIVALMQHNAPVTAIPLPGYLEEAAERVAHILHLPAD